MGRRSRQSKATSPRSTRSTLPDYSVEEDKFGRLVNKEKRLVWPSDKQLSQKQFNQFLDTAPPEEEDGGVSTDRERKECLTFHEKYAYGKENDNLFIGVATADEAAERVKETTSFCLYYQKKKMVETELHLCMAYRRISGAVLHFPVVRTSHRRPDQVHDDFYWHIEAGSEERNHRFTSLAALVKYYQLFSYYDPATGLMENFVRN